MVTVFGEALAQIHHTDILNTCVCGEHFPLMGQCVARIQIEHRETTAGLALLPSLLPQTPVSFLLGWGGVRREGEGR